MLISRAILSAVCSIHPQVVGKLTSDIFRCDQAKKRRKLCCCLSGRHCRELCKIGFTFGCRLPGAPQIFFAHVVTCRRSMVIAWIEIVAVVTSAFSAVRRLGNFVTDIVELPM